jgi:hypothetical protein
MDDLNGHAFSKAKIKLNFCGSQNMVFERRKKFTNGWNCLNLQLVNEVPRILTEKQLRVNMHCAVK